ncbi:hypothetical protein XELAEV_18037209mg [Xenopus laevis]|uniref:Uncharacterized protein n=1 Tax=Xenopus laevis TaxID=8355 RepID=A0A974CCC1_XENLA|nr:hypothetical protein XELAEV_18037209mg [Xenopus laevis]
MTFAYSDQDVKRITDAVRGQNEFLNSKDCFQEFRALERLQPKHTAYDLHLRTLAEYVKLQRIPRGLRAHLSPTLFSDNEEYCTGKWEAIINKCSLDLMQLQIALPEVKGETERMEESIQNSFETAVVAEVESRKRNKFQRDAEDYKTGTAYRWRTKGYGKSLNDRKLMYQPKQRGYPERSEKAGQSGSVPGSPASTSSTSFLDGSQATATSEEENAEGANTTKKQQRS